MAKVTCSVRLESSLKDDLDKLTQFNGQTLGFMVNDAMEDMLIELIRDIESRVRDNGRKHYNICKLLDYLKSSLGDDNALDKVKCDFDLLDSLNRKDKNEWPVYCALLSFLGEYEGQISYPEIVAMKDILELDNEEYMGFLKLADQFESIGSTEHKDWVDSDYKITDKFREEFEEAYSKYSSKDTLSERLNKISYRYGFPDYKEMWNGKIKTSARFLNHFNFYFKHMSFL